MSNNDQRKVASVPLLSSNQSIHSWLLVLQYSWDAKQLHRLFMQHHHRVESYNFFREDTWLFTTTKAWSSVCPLGCD
jgi:hypothetical protein